MSPRTARLTTEQVSAEHDLKTAFMKGLCEAIEEVTGLEAEEVTLEKNFVDDLDIDSLSMVEMAVYAEDTYGIEIPDRDLASLRTVNDVQCYMLRMVRDNPEAMTNLAAKNGRDDLVDAIKLYAATN